MNARQFVAELSAISLRGVFNPYADRCSTHDLPDGPRIRRENLESYLNSVEALGCDTIWMGRDLGYRGGRRTGLALTDEKNLSSMEKVYKGARLLKATKGPVVSERTAAEIWAVIGLLDLPPMLWNVFPFHPHEPNNEFTNRKFTRPELMLVEDISRELASWLRIETIVSIGQDAAKYAESFDVPVRCVRHPSYGGVAEFRAGINQIYGKTGRVRVAQVPLF